MIQTERATDRWDLPHTFVERKGAIAAADFEMCECGRSETNPLHRPVLHEKASASPTIVTEKGI